MATVYKIEIEVVSDWVNLDEETIQRKIKEKIEDTHSLLRQEFRVSDIKVERK